MLLVAVVLRELARIADHLLEVRLEGGEVRRLPCVDPRRLSLRLRDAPFLDQLRGNCAVSVVPLPHAANARLLHFAQPVVLAELGEVPGQLVGNEKFELLLRQETSDLGACENALRRHVRVLVPAEESQRRAVLGHLAEVIPICIERVHRAPLRRSDRLCDGMRGVYPMRPIEPTRLKGRVSPALDGESRGNGCSEPRMGPQCPVIAAVVLPPGQPTGRCEPGPVPELRHAQHAFVAPKGVL